jgi:Ca2+-binding EF-hand superfamily protein
MMAAMTNPEVRELLQLPPVFSNEFDEVFERLDADKNDAVSFEEFQHFFLPSASTGVDAKYARVKAGFDLMDVNGDGSLTRTEILTALMGEQSIRDLLMIPDPETEEFEDMYRKVRPPPPSPPLASSSNPILL